MKQLNGSPEIEEHRKVRIHKNGEKILQNSSPGESDRCENNFMYVDHQDNIIQTSRQSFPINYFISLRNSGIYRQISKETFWLNRLTEVEIIEFTLVEEGGLGDIPKPIPLARSQVKSRTPLNNQ